MSLITLLTDFGIRDGGAAVMKGVIYGIAPAVPIVDLSHTVGPQNIREATIILRRVAPYFPPGTIHVVVVDPGVGTERRPLAARLGPHYFVGPDNGLFTPLLERAERHYWPIEVIQLDNPDYWLPEISHVFHGRDIFAPVSAHLAKGEGVPLLALGTPVDDPVRLPLPEPEQITGGLKGQVIQIDDFGNVATNIFREHLDGLGPEVTVRLCGVEIAGLARTDTILHYLNIAHLYSRETFQLSGGEKQKVVIASTLVLEPSILLLDEPLANLDPYSLQETLALIRRLADEGKTILLIEHRVEDVLKIRPDKVLFLVGGRQRYFGGVEGFKAVADPREVKLAAPLTIKRMKQEGLLTGNHGQKPSSPDIERPATDKALLEFKDVSFWYEPEKLVLRNGRAVTSWNGSVAGW